MFEPFFSSSATSSCDYSESTPITRGATGSRENHGADKARAAKGRSRGRDHANSDKGPWPTHIISGKISKVATLAQLTQSHKDLPY